MSEREQTDLERVEELFALLQGVVPDDIRIKRHQIPKLTPDQAETVIWYIQNQYWQIPDHIERCGVCGDYYDSRSEGSVLDYGKGPYHFCGVCENGDEFERKEKRRPKGET